MLTKKIATLCIAVVTSQLAFAVTPSAEQLAQFQRLPRAQQEMLAQQYGFDLSSLDGASAPAQRESSTVAAPVRATKPLQQHSNLIAQPDSETKLKNFGYQVLSGEVETNTPVDNLPVPLDYVMESGDEISVQIYGKTNKQLALKIDREGKINLPELGPIAVSGQTFAQVRDQITQMVERKIIGVEVVVSMANMRTMQVYVVGEASNPGAYNVNGLTTITQALIASGGIEETGSLRNIQLKRKGKVVARLDLYDLLLKGDTSSDVRLLAGDTLFVPAKTSNLTIDGEVLRPAIYELRGSTTLASALNMAGGALPKAYLSKVNVRRHTASGIKQFTLDMTKSAGRQFKLQSGDEVKLNPASANLRNAVALRGEVVRQGAQSFQPGMRVTDVITSIENDLKFSADLNYALLVREVDDSRNIEVLQFNLGNALRNPQSADNLALHEKDQIFVFDNGIEIDYWYGKQQNAKARVNRSGEDLATMIQPGLARETEFVDTETGATVTNDNQLTLNVEGVEKVSTGESLQLTSREALLKPIIERLKAQATFDDPARLVTISGAVKFPGTYPLTKQSDIAKLVAAAGGMLEKTYLKSAELTRSTRDGDRYSTQHYTFSLEEALGGAKVINLRPLDSLVVKTIPDWQQDMTVELQGEVVFPGTYSFRRGETLQDVVARAGGLTQYAYPDGAVFSREQLKRQEQERLLLLNNQLKQEIASLSLRRQNSSATYPTRPSEALEIVDQLSNVKPVGRLVIDLPEALEGSSSANIMLEKGDKLYIPAVNSTVSIMGEVQLASNHTFQPGMTVEDYISAAGGTKKQADTDRIYVVRANGSVMIPNNSFWFSRKDKPLEPGDTIVVPIDTDYLDGLSTLTSATQILYQIGVAWSAVNR
ncbi:SLBB domain-containing protein [Vibrio sp.]|uniref:SLBB domain-containing protein n=1 Tax=Vibrio sp. TaxID=678 RepID=UPI003D10F38E